MEFFYDIPERSENKFDGSDIMLRDTFNVDGLTYAVAGYDSVQLVSVSEGGRVVIPESVTYGGKSFKVISVGRIENGLFNIGSIAFDYEDHDRGLVEITEIVIPKTVIFIWDGAFGIDTLEAITVDEDNECFKSVGGVLFTEDMKVLIKYPSGKADTTYVIPDTVVEIAEGAFSMFYINLDLKLESIKVGLNTKYAGLYNRGYGYDHAGNPDASRSDDEWQVIASYLSGEAKIYDCDGNEIIVNVN
jgi:hypothetical protein